MSETSSSEQDRSQEVLRAIFKRDKTYDNKTGKIQPNRRTTYKKENHRVAGTSKLSEWDLRGTCNYGGCPHGGDRDGNVTKVQGTYNRPPSQDRDPGCIGALQSNQEVLAGNKLEIDWKEKRVGTLRSQVCQLDGLPTRWHGWRVVACLSHDDHVIWKATVPTRLMEYVPTGVCT